MIVQGAQFTKLGLGERSWCGKFARSAAMCYRTDNNRVALAVLARICGGLFGIAPVGISSVRRVLFPIGRKIGAALLLIGMVKRALVLPDTIKVLFSPLATIFLALLCVGCVVAALRFFNLFSIFRTPQPVVFKFRVGHDTLLIRANPDVKMRGAWHQVPRCQTIDQTVLALQYYTIKRIIMHSKAIYGVRRAAQEFATAHGWPITFVLPCNGMAVLRRPE